MFTSQRRRRRRASGQSEGSNVGRNDFVAGQTNDQANRRRRIDRRSRLFTMAAEFGEAQMFPTYGHHITSNTVIGLDGSVAGHTTFQRSGLIQMPPSMGIDSNCLVGEQSEPQQRPVYSNVIHNLGSPTEECQFCGALFWSEERCRSDRTTNLPIFTACCQRGRVNLPLLPETPPYLETLLDINGGEESKHFRNCIRSYNAAFSFTSFGAKFDPRLMDGRGPFSLVLCGDNYHLMGSLVPESGQRPKYAQLYVFDSDNELQNRLHNFSGPDRELRPNIMSGLQSMLNEMNCLVQSFRRISRVMEDPNNRRLRLRIVGSRVLNDRRYDLPTGVELAGLIPDDFQVDYRERDIIVDNVSRGLVRITSLNPKFHSLHFPLLFPYGEDGFHMGILYDSRYKPTNLKRPAVTAREYYAFRLQYRNAEGKTLIRSGKMLQHYCIDAYTIVEQNRLKYVYLYQHKLRSEVYNGLYDAFEGGDLYANNHGQVILPSSYVGGPRYMKQLYLDAMAVCQHYGNPDLFITFTCNAQWPEIVESFSTVVGTRCEEKHMLAVRVFAIKLSSLKKDIKKMKFFGATVADIHTIEFQKRGLPHVHILIWLCPKSKPCTPEDVDKIISAEIPDPTLDPVGYEAVSRFMMHGPCGDANPLCPCMEDNVCKKKFPKSFAEETSFDGRGYVSYRRRNLGISVLKSGTPLTNQHVVPYNRDLLVKYQAHMNVEICHQGRLIKYLFKYITKGVDRSAVLADNVAADNGNPVGYHAQPINEVRDFLDCRSISAYEALWRLYEYPIHERTPNVVRLCVHLPGFQRIIYDPQDPLRVILARPGVSRTMLTQWFKLNQTFPPARQYRYVEIPNNFVWVDATSEWYPRKRGFAIGRLNYVPPSAEEPFYLRLLLTKVKGALGFDDLRTVNGVLHGNFREACEALGLLSTDDEWDSVMAEVSRWGQPSLLRNLFISLLVFCQVANPSNLFNSWWEAMAEDFSYRHRQLISTSNIEPPSDLMWNQVLHAIQTSLQVYSKSLQDYNLPIPIVEYAASNHNALIAQYLKYNAREEAEKAERLHSSLNSCQLRAYNSIMTSIDNDSGGLFFLHGHGGTGKTYLYNCILAEVRGRQKIVLVVASSGIAATLLPDACTAHSLFKIPLEVEQNSTCGIKKGTQLAELIRLATLVIWDEAPMIHKLSFEAVDRTFCDIMDIPLSGTGYVPFGGKTILLGGDFRQTLPVVTNGGRGDSIHASLMRSYLWEHCQVLELVTNMRLANLEENLIPIINGKSFQEWVLSVGNDDIDHIPLANSYWLDWIKIPNRFLVPKNNNPIASIAAAVYKDFEAQHQSLEYINGRAIVTPTNKNVDEINQYMLRLIPGEARTYYSSDSIVVPGGASNLLDVTYPPEFLNTLSFSNYPDHQLQLKQHVTVMLLRNLNPSAGLCNGTRVLITFLGQNVIMGIIIGGSFQGTEVAIPRIILEKTDYRWPFTLKRRQFPIRVCYAMTINKSQGQTLDCVGLYLSKPVFSHGQLYVALSRVRSPAGLRILLDEDEENSNSLTRNIVYKEVLAEVNSRTFGNSEGI